VAYYGLGDRPGRGLRLIVLAPPTAGHTMHI
jgi:hypothetical protein